MKTPSINIKKFKKNENNRHSMPLLLWPFCSTSSSPIISVNTPSYSDNPSLRSIPSYQTDLIRDPNNEELKSLQDQINLLSKKLVFAEQTLYEWKTEFYDLQNRFQDTLNEHSVTIEELKHTRRMLQESEHVRSRWFLKTPSSIALNHQPKEELDTEDHNSVNKASLRSLSKIKVLRFFKAQA